jgi:hypothetical protein
MPQNLAKSITNSEKKLGKGTKGDVVVIHTTKAYDGQVALVAKKDIQSYFSEDNGFEEHDAGTVSSLTSGKTYSIGAMKNDEIIVVML